MREAKLPKLSFKKEPRQTGLAGVGYPYRNVTVKMDGKEVGTLHAPNWQTKGDVWECWFMVYGDTGNPNCNWQNRRLKTLLSEAAARQWVKDYWPRIVELGLRAMDA